MGDDRESYWYYAVADIDTGDYTDVGKLEVNTASGADVVIGDSYYAWLTSDYTGENCLIRVNAADKSLTVLEKRKTDHPQLIRLDKYSETEFISTVYEQAGGEMQTVVELYDVTTGGKRELMRLRYRNDEQKADSEGVVLEAVCAMDGNIYGVGREKHDGQYRCYFYTYRDGALQSAVEAPVLAAQLNNTIPLSLYKAGDYFVLSDWNFNWMLYRLTGQGVEREPLPLAANKCRFALNMENFNDSTTCRYLFYYPMGEMEQTDTADFYAFDIRTGKHYKIDARFLSTHRYLNSLSVDETGNILLTFETHFCGFDFRYYLLPAQDIPVMLQPVS